jgi:DNA-binding NarL/FixJ family response regulator
VIRLLLVDDQPGTRRGLRMRLELEADVTVVGEAADGAAALRLADELNPDVVVMDVAMPIMDGITATKALCRSHLADSCAVVILSLYDDAVTQARAREAGAVAFVGKHRMDEPLLAAIRAAARAA